jgi:hypothetical protein
LCLEGDDGETICLDKTQLKQLLENQNQNINGSSGSNGGGGAGSTTEPACTPNWQCSDWQPAPETQTCGQTFKQTRTCNDGCENEETEEQELKGTYCEQGTCDLEKGECQLPDPQTENT